MSFNLNNEHIEAHIGEEVLKTIRECSQRYASAGRININVKFLPDNSTQPVEKSICVNLTNSGTATSPGETIASEPVVMVPLHQIQTEPLVEFVPENLVYATNVYFDDSDSDTEMRRVSPPPRDDKCLAFAPRNLFNEEGMSPANIYKHQYVGHETLLRCPKRGCNKQFHSRKGLTKHLVRHRSKSLRSARGRDKSMLHDKMGSEKMLRPRNIANPRENSSALGKVLRKKQLMRLSRRRSQSKQAENE